MLYSIRKRHGHGKVMLQNRNRPMKSMPTGTNNQPWRGMPERSVYKEIFSLCREDMNAHAPRNMISKQHDCTPESIRV